MGREDNVESQLAKQEGEREQKRGLKVREKSLEVISWAMIACMGSGPSFVWEERAYLNALNGEVS